MIHLSTNKIYLKSSSEELFDFMGSLENIAQIITFKRVKHLKIEGDILTFILKWAARFNFKITEKTDRHILIASADSVEFETALRFDIEPEENGASVTIHIETDTAPFIDFTFEKKVRNWVEAMAENLEQKFGTVEA